MDTQRVTTEGIRAALRILNKRRTELAMVLGLSLNSVNQKMTGKVRWSLHDAVRISEWLGIPMGDLVAGEQRVIESIAWRLDQEAQRRNRERATA